jgi:hypothetical protein
MSHPNGHSLAHRRGSGSNLGRARGRLTVDAARSAFLKAQGDRDAAADAWKPELLEADAKLARVLRCGSPARGGDGRMQLIAAA